MVLDAQKHAWLAHWPEPKRDRPIGQLLLDSGAIDSQTLSDALAKQAFTRVRLGDILIAEGAVDHASLAAALAEQSGLAHVDLRQSPPDRTEFRPEDLELYLRYRILPWRKVGSLVAYVTSEPQTAQQALGELRPGSGLAFVVVAGRDAVDQAILDLAGPELAERAALKVPADQSVRGLTFNRWIPLLFLAAIAILAWQSWPLVLGAVGLGILLMNAATTVTRVAAVAASLPRSDEDSTDDGTVSLAEHRPLPVISILIPLYREAGMIPTIVSALGQLDYPRALLDVKLLLEADDRETQQAAAEADLPGWIEALVLPDGQPRTKPRAMNLALDFCRGDIVGILDAEDRPSPDQLRAVAGHLASAPRETACVQCRLTWFNSRENWITRCFLIEYAIWFDVLLGGFQRLGLPIPLGGTSVYFRRSALEALKGWDAHNVTEDADLGMRLARRGWHCAVLEQTTEEEASFRILPWIRQRSRWLKGYVMTWASHMRSPGLLWKELGPKGFLGLNVLFLGGAVTYLAMPLFWIALSLTLITGASVFGGILPGWLITVLGVSLVVGQLVMLGCAGLALWRRSAFGLLGWVFTLPVYWTMGAIAAWKAIIEIFWAPYYWDKTEHGVSRFSEGPKGEK